MAFDEVPRTQFRVRLDGAVGVAGREVLVVEDPDLHAALFAFGEDDVHVAPPAVAAEIGMGARLDAEGAAPACADAGNLLGDLRAVVAVLPVEGEEVVVRVSGEDVAESGIHHLLPRAETIIIPLRAFGLGAQNSFEPVAGKTV